LRGVDAQSGLAVRLRRVRKLPAIERGHRRALSAVLLATVVAVVLTLNRYGMTVDGVGWSGAQLLLGFVAGWDILTRRILNVVLLPASLLVIVVRVSFAPGALLESLVAGAAAFTVFLVVALASRDGIGIGDVKLAGFLGLLLGRAVLGALIAGCVAGGIAAVLLLVTGSAERRSTFAYGPYLALGGALWIVLGDPPSLF
jgi:leader peptidase (prepilin peptidase)/N-methyltransferase